MIYPYKAIDIELTLHNGLHLPAQLLRYIGYIGEEELAADRLIISPILLSRNWPTPDGDSLSTAQVGDWLCASILSDSQIEGIHPELDYLRYRVLNPDDLDMPENVEVYAFGSSLDLLALCHTKDADHPDVSRRILITPRAEEAEMVRAHFPQLPATTITLHDAWEPLYAKAHLGRTPEKVFFKAAELCVRLQRQLSWDTAQETLAQEIADSFPTLSATQSKTFYQAARTCHDAEALYAAFPADVLQSATQKALLVGLRRLGLQQANHVPAGDIHANLPMAPVGATLKEQQVIVALHNGTQEGTAYRAKWENFKGEEREQLLGVALPELNGTVTLYRGEHAAALILSSCSDERPTRRRTSGLRPR